MAPVLTFMVALSPFPVTSNVIGQIFAFFTARRFISLRSHADNMETHTINSKICLIFMTRS